MPYHRQRPDEARRTSSQRSRPVPHPIASLDTTGASAPIPSRNQPPDSRPLPPGWTFVERPGGHRQFVHLPTKTVSGVHPADLGVASHGVAEVTIPTRRRHPDEPGRDTDSARHLSGRADLPSSKAARQDARAPHSTLSHQFTNPAEDLPHAPPPKRLHSLKEPVTCTFRLAEHATLLVWNTRELLLSWLSAYGFVQTAAAGLSQNAYFSASNSALSGCTEVARYNAIIHVWTRALVPIVVATVALYILVMGWQTRHCRFGEVDLVLKLQELRCQLVHKVYVGINLAAFVALLVWALVRAAMISDTSLILGLCFQAALIVFGFLSAGKASQVDIIDAFEPKYTPFTDVDLARVHPMVYNGPALADTKLALAEPEEDFSTTTSPV